MTGSNWQDKNIVKGWSKANGSSDWPFGDNWRMALINPIVLCLAKSVQSKLLDLKKPISFYKALADQRASAFSKKSIDKTI